MSKKTNTPQTTTRSKVSIFCTHAIEALWLFLLVAVPLFFYLSYKTFDLPKTHLFSSVVVLMLALWLIKSLEESKFNIKFNWLSWILVAYFLILSLASLFGISPKISWWGSYDRFIGLSAYAIFFIFSLVVSWQLKTRGQLFRIILALSLGSFIVSILGIMQYYGFELYAQAGDMFKGGRVISTLGNALYLSGYLTVAAPFSLALALIVKKYYFKIFWLAVLATSIYAIILTGSRSGYVALVAMSIIGALLIVLRRSKKAFLITLLALIIISAVAYANFNTILESASGSENKFIQRAASSFNLEDVTVKERLAVWQISLNIILKRPILGYGQETFSYSFDRYYPTSFTNVPENWFDRAHNIILDTAYASGFIGLAAFLALIVGAAYVYIKQFLKTNDPVRKYLAFAAALSLVGFVVHNQFMFEDVTERFLVFLIFGMAIFLVFKPRPRQDSATPEGKQITRQFWNSPELKLVYYAILAGAIAFIIYFYVFPVSGDYYFNLAQNYSSVSQKDTRQYYLEKAMYYAHDSKEYKYQQQMGSLFFIVAQNIQSEQNKINNFQKSEEWYLRAHKTNPLSYHTLLDLAQVYTIWSQYEPEKIDQGVEMFNKALERSPNRQMIYWDWGRSLIKIGKAEEGIAKYQHAVDMDPSVGRSYFELGKAYRDTDQPELAQEAFDMARELGWTRGSEEEPL